MVSSATSSSLTCSPLASWPAGAAALADAVYETRQVRVLSFAARVTAEASLLRLLQPLLPAGPAWASAGAHPAVWYRVERDRPRPGAYLIVHDGETGRWSTRPEDLVVPLVWNLHQAAAQHLRDRYLFFHAGAVALGGRGFLFPAASGSGKSTLVAGLVAAGFEYISDDIVPVDPAGLAVLPFPKCIGVKPGARRALSSLYPQLWRETPRYRVDGELVSYLAPPERAWPAAPAPVRFVILPKYVRGAQTTLVRARPSEVLPQLTSQSFNLRAHGAVGLGRIVELLRTAECYRLTVGDLRRAVDLLEDLTAS